MCFICFSAKSDNLEYTLREFNLTESLADLQEAKLMKF